MIQEITLSVPAGYELPFLYSQMDAQMTADVLSLGASAQNQITSQAQKQQNQALQDKLREEAQQQQVPHIESLEKLLSEKSVVVENTQKQMKALEQQIQESTRLRFQQEEVHASRIRDEERRNREEILAEKERSIVNLKSQIEVLQKNLGALEASLRDNTRSVCDNLQNFKEAFLKTATNSQKRGEQGERLFGDILQRTFGSTNRGDIFEIQEVAKEGHQGDLKMRWQNQTILWEVKNQSNTVPRDEVTKFHRDMVENQDCDIGVLVSLHTGIVGHHKAGNLDMDEEQDGRPCLYLTNFLSHADPVGFLQAVKPLLEAFLEHRKASSVTNALDEESKAKRLQERFESQRAILIRLFQQHMEGMRDFKNLIANAQTKTEQIWRDLTTDVKKKESDLKHLQQTLLDMKTSMNEDVDMNQAEDTNALPSYVFKQTDLRLQNENQRQFIQDMLRLCEFDEDATIVKKDLKELFKGLGLSEDAVGKRLEEILLEEVWNKGKPAVKAIRKKVVPN